ncbi:MAG: PD-(D/E)XK nuclease family protein, partial [Candidatus Aminicenantes bacterium]|nr:PD-(D/E)XK nuclease family protein [Candidatus Aminicenantes bacterium]
MKRHIHISVKDLVKHLFREGDICFSFGQLSKNSGLQGIRAHQKIQNSRPSSYMAEVHVDYQTESENIILHIQGRIDGIYEKEGQVVLEEIKTSNTELENFINTNNVLHWAQVKIYAAIFANKHHLHKLQIQLTYFHIETQNIKTLYQQFSVEELNIFLHAAVSVYLGWLDKIELWHKERDVGILGSNFPYRFFRDGQIDMMADVANAIKHQEQLIIQAPTGIGKTVAVLYPAIKALAEGYTQKIFYLTARSTGHKIVEKTLHELGEKGIK